MLIPGRPQTKENLSVGRAYRHHVEDVARRQRLPYHGEGPVPITLELYYAVAPEDYDSIVQRPATWYLRNLPRGNNAAELILTALAGYLYQHAGQVEPLTVVRQLLTPEQLEQRFGRACRDGCAVVKYPGVE